jgi:hypothetical protein
MDDRESHSMSASGQIREADVTAANLAKSWIPSRPLLENLNLENREVMSHRGSAFQTNLRFASELDFPFDVRSSGCAWR